MVNEKRKTDKQASLRESTNDGKIPVSPDLHHMRLLREGVPIGGMLSEKPPDVVLNIMPSSPTPPDDEDDEDYAENTGVAGMEVGGDGYFRVPGADIASLPYVAHESEVSL